MTHAIIIGSKTLLASKSQMIIRRVVAYGPALLNPWLAVGDRALYRFTGRNVRRFPARQNAARHEEEEAGAADTYDPTGWIR
jgi:hypothetical protein